MYSAYGEVCEVCGAYDELVFSGPCEVFSAPASQTGASQPNKFCREFMSVRKMKGAGWEGKGMKEDDLDRAGGGGSIAS